MTKPTVSVSHLSDNGWNRIRTEMREKVLCLAQSSKNINFFPIFFFPCTSFIYTLRADVCLCQCWACLYCIGFQRQFASAGIFIVHSLSCLFSLLNSPCLLLILLWSHYFFSAFSFSLSVSGLCLCSFLLSHDVACLFVRQFN